MIDCLEEAVGRLNRERTETVIIGDLNMDYSNKGILRRNSVKSFENATRLRQIITEYTRITPTTSSILDLIYTDSPHIIKSGTLNVNLSDHLPVYLIKTKERNKINKKKGSRCGGDPI